MLPQYYKASRQLNIRLKLYLKILLTLVLTLFAAITVLEIKFADKSLTLSNIETEINSEKYISSQNKVNLLVSLNKELSSYQSLSKTLQPNRLKSDLFEIITANLPDNVFLTSIQIENMSAVVSGISQSRMQALIYASNMDASKNVQKSSLINLGVGDKDIAFTLNILFFENDSPD